jgi:hypothetical protein
MWNLIERSGGQIGWREHGGCFFVGCLKANGNAVELVQAVRHVARSRGHQKIFWQVVPETGPAMLKTLGKGRAKIDFVQMYCDV